MRLNTANLLEAEITTHSTNLGVLAGKVSRSTTLLSEVFARLRADKPKVRYGCLKLLRIISEEEPATLYPLFERFVELLDSENKILKWGAIIILGNLATVDSAGKLERTLDRYLRPISGPVMITAANTIRGAGTIAQAKPQLADKIARSLLKVEAAKYQTPECRNVALGHAVASLDVFFEHIRAREPVVAFVERQLRNRRPAVRRKAAVFLKKRAGGVL